MDTSADETDNEEEEDQLAALTLHDPYDAGIQAARFSINVIDIFNSPKPIELGMWNTRALKEREAVKLKNKMLENSIRSFSYENLFHCIVDRQYIDPRCINGTLSMAGHEAPPLKLTDEGRAKLKSLWFAGGRHRIRATELLKEERQGKLEKMKQALIREQGKGEKVAVLEKEIEDETKSIARLGFWGIILYDSSKFIHIIDKLKS